MSEHERVAREDQARERLHRLAAEAQDGDEWAKQELIRVMRPMVLGQVNKIKTENMYNYYNAKQELIQAGYTGVMEAIHRFNPEREKSSFWSLAYWRIRHELSEWLAKNAGGIPMPRSAWRKGYHIEKAEENEEDHDIHGAEDIQRAKSSNYPIFEATELPDSVRDDEDRKYIIGFFNSLASMTVEERRLAAKRFVHEMGWKYEIADRIVREANETFD